LYLLQIDYGRYELDFIIENERGELISVEVKVGDSLKAKSFKTFCEKHQPKTAIRISLSNYRKESWMTNVPLYFIGEYFYSI
jgi:hypothetical protein